MFYEHNGILYRGLMESENGIYMIEHIEYGKGIVYVDKSSLERFQKVKAPYTYLRNREMNPSDAKRYAMIRALVEDSGCICDRKRRSAAAKGLASEYDTTARRILNTYYKYMATGTVAIHRHPKETVKNTVFEKAIRKYYYSAKRLSLRDTFDMMIMEFFSDGSGKIKEDAPTFNVFRNYYYRHELHKKKEKKIGRNGMGDYLRNERPVMGNASNWKDRLGWYQMDAQEADVYLISRYDGEVIPKRPFVYLAVDTVSQLIAGVHVSFEEGSDMVMACIAQASTDKVTYCRRYGIDIEADAWPNRDLPCGIVTDRGSEFIGSRTEELCAAFDVEIESLPPYRPDEKGLVEKSFDLIQRFYKPILRGYGTIEDDAGERWSVNYIEQATLTIEDFTKIILKAIIYLNTRIMEEYVPPKEMVTEHVPVTASGVWNMLTKTGKNGTIPVDQRKFRLMSLPRENASLSRKGLKYGGFIYVSKELPEILEHLRTTKVQIAYDPENVTSVWLLPEYKEFTLSVKYDTFRDVSGTEKEEGIRKRKETDERIAADDERERVEVLRFTKEILERAKDKAKERGRYH